MPPRRLQMRRRANPASPASRMGGTAQRRIRPGQVPGGAPDGGPSFREQGAAYVSPNISGEQPTGDLFGGHGQGTTLEQIRRNEFLNTLSEPDKMRAMNRMGYWNEGVPVRATRGFRPGQEYVQGVTLDPGQAHNVETNGVFQGQVVSEGGQNVWNPLRPGGAAGPRVPGPIRGRDEGRPIAPDRPPGGQGNIPGGVNYFPPGGGGGGGRPPAGGGGRDGERTRRRGPRGRRDGQGGEDGGPLQHFLPMTAEYEAARRQLEDQLSGTESNLMLAQGLVDPSLQFQLARLGTDEGYALDALKQQTAERGIYGGGAYDFLRGRDIGVPFGRARQDLALGAGQQYADLAGQLGEAGLGYNQGILEALLDRAQQVATELPLSLPQYAGGRGGRGGRGRRNRGRGRNRNRGRGRNR